MTESRRCNLCGSKFDQWEEQEDFSIHRNVGYGSKYDLHRVELNLCCGCYDKLITYIVNNGAISPVVRELQLLGGM